LPYNYISGTKKGAVAPFNIHAIPSLLIGTKFILHLRWEYYNGNKEKMQRAEIRGI